MAISPTEKQTVREILVSNMNQKSYRIKTLIAQILSTIVIYDYPDVWDEFLEKICEGLADDDISQVD